MKSIKLLLLLMIVAIGMQSCREDSDIINVTLPPTETGMNVQGSIFGTVVDQNGQAVADATVTYGDLTVASDQYGVFQFDDETLYTGGTYIKVEKEGYFNGSRKFYPSEGTTSRVNVELMAMVQVANFQSAAGEKVQFEGVEIAFGNDAIMRDDGSSYDGNVNVFAKYLEPTLLATLNQMPGDLTAIDQNDDRVILTTYGMITVELRDDAGLELQVKNGSTAEISMPVPVEILGNAPQTIPLWHFDEEIGTWIEEGEASLVNGAYVGQVSHFSFWNCDDPSKMIHLSGSILNRGVPVQGGLVKITLTNDNASGSGYTNNEGQFGGFVPKGEELLIEIFDHCGNLIYTITIGPFEENTVLDPFNLNITALQAILSGTVTSCDGSPSLATYVVIQQDDITSIVGLDDDNSFETNIFYCEEGEEITVGAEDPLNQLASANSVFTVEGNIDIGNLELCEESISQLLYYKYGDQEFLTNGIGQDSFFFGYNTQVINNPGSVDKVIYSVTILDWNTDNVYDFNLVYEEGMPMQQVTMPVPLGGFNASGTATIQKVQQGGEEYLTASGILSEMDIIDNALYDPSYNPLEFYTAIRL